MSGSDPIFEAKPGSMQAHAVNGAVAIAIAQIVKLPFQAASLIVLPRILMPVDYGIYAMVDPLLSMSILLIDFGISQAVVQAPQITRAQVNGLFWIQVIVGLSAAALMFLASPLISAFYHEPRAGALAAASSLFLAYAGLVNIPETLMNRQMKFGWLAVISATGVSVGLLTGVVAAKSGLHYWALTLDYAATCLVNLIGVWLCCGWTPRERPDFSGLLRFFKFGGAVMLSDAASAISRQADSVLIGRYAGPSQLGFYDRGAKLAVVPLQRINQVFQSVLLPILSRMREDGERYRQAYLRMIRQLMLFLSPGTVAVGVTAPVLIPFLLGGRWAASAPILAWLTLSALHRPISMTMNLLFVSQGRARAYMVWSVFSAVTSVLSFIIGLRWGAVGVAAAFALSDVTIRLPFLWWWVTRSGPIKFLDLINATGPFAAGSAACFVAVTLLQHVPIPNVVARLAASVVLAYAVSWATVAVFKGGRMTMADTGRLMRTELPRFLPPFLRSARR